MDEINEELQQKSIEKSQAVAHSAGEGDNLQVTIQPEEKPKKTKKQRTQKQIDAFEKARANRSEQVAEIQKKKQLVKQEKKVKIKEFKETLSKPPVTFVEEKSVMPAQHSPADGVGGISVYSPGMNQPQERHREQIVNNYYYYGPTPSAPPQGQQQGSQGPRPITPPPAVRRQKPPPEPSSSEEEYYEEEPFVQQEPKFQYQYNYV